MYGIMFQDTVRLKGRPLIARPRQFTTKGKRSSRPVPSSAAWSCAAKLAHVTASCFAVIEMPSRPFRAALQPSAMLLRIHRELEPHMIRDDVVPHDHLVDLVARRVKFHSDIQEQLLRHPGELVVQIHLKINSQPGLRAAVGNRMVRGSRLGAFNGTYLMCTRSISCAYIAALNNAYLNEAVLTRSHCSFAILRL